MAERELRVANRELIALLHQVALWRAMAYDRELPNRLGKSYAARGFLTTRTALLNGAVLSISRLFDGTRTSLHLNRTFSCLLKPEGAAWLRERRVTGFRDLPAVDQDGQPWREEVWAVLQSMAERDAAGAAIRFDEELKEFKQAKRRFTAGDAGAALARLQELRDKEIAHTDLQPEWATSRPKLADLDIVLDALKELLARANRLCTGLDINTETFSQTAEMAARCFIASLRMETPEERRAARTGIRGDSPTVPL